MEIVLMYLSCASDADDDDACDAAVAVFSLIPSLAFDLFNVCK